jgi:hypothetical protein
MVSEHSKDIHPFKNSPLTTDDFEFLILKKSHDKKPFIDRLPEFEEKQIFFCVKHPGISHWHGGVSADCSICKV